MYDFTEMTPLVRFVENPVFHAYLKQNAQPFIQDFFDPEKTQFLPLIYALPFYRMSEPLQGQSLLTMEEVTKIINYCNHNR